ncbi:MAG: peptide chain release factor 2 [Elusimicrobiota bacterium]|nr:peptide chain release factor 2 [Elusimicrobiota bacterium]
MRRSFELEKKEYRIRELEKSAAKPDFWENHQFARNVMQELDFLKSTQQQWNSFRKHLADLKTIIELVETHGYDQSLEKEFKAGLKKLQNEISLLEIEAKLSEPTDKLNAIVSIHAGAGGTEACDWAEMLLRMYTRWAEKHVFKVEIVDLLPGEEAGIKSVTFIVRGNYAYGLLKSEIGVHRLVRISPFDANKRRHTSFASCDVIPEIEDEIEIKIDEKDLRIDTFRASGHGGQHLQKTDSAVRITHLPSGIVVQCQNERSQYKNKMTALKILKAKLYELEQEKLRSELEKHYSEKGTIAWGNQIRSYVFMPYKQVKDHRTGVEIKDVESVMNGEIDIFIERYLSHKIVNKLKFS